MTYPLGILAICVFILIGFPSLLNGASLFILALLIIRRTQGEN